jgi:hypothetical protein
LPSQKALGEKLLAQGTQIYNEFLSSIAIPQDLTKTVEIPSSKPGQITDSYQAVLDDPAEYTRLMKENPELVAELERNYRRQ